MFKNGKYIKKQMSSSQIDDGEDFKEFILERLGKNEDSIEFY